MSSSKRNPGFYATRRQAHAAWYRMVRKAKRKNRVANISIQLCPFGYYLKGVITPVAVVTGLTSQDFNGMVNV